MSSSWLYRMRRVVRFIPRSPRCKLCNVPFAGPGRVFRLAGFGQSRKNPNMCTACFERAPVGGAELVAVGRCGSQGQRRELLAELVVHVARNFWRRSTEQPVTS